MRSELATEETEAAASAVEAGAEGSAADRTGPRRGAFAALDLGTNNCRLLIARPRPGGFRVVDSLSRITRLGEGLTASGRLSDAAMDRTVDALAACVEKMRRRNVVRARAVATEACRRAVNCDVLIERAANEAGVRIEIISAGEEAHLMLAGCAPLIAPEATGAIVFDIGGGSTEVMWVRPQGKRPEVQGWLSLPVGVVTLAEEFGVEGFDEAAYAAVVERVQTELSAFAEEHGIGQAIATGRVQMLGCSGTVTTLAGVILGLARYDRGRVDGMRIGFSAIAAASRRLMELDLAGRAAHPCVGPERSDLVVPGCAMLEAIRRVFPVGELTVADRGVREGILLDLMTSGAP